MKNENFLKGHISIACYKPKEAKEEGLLKAVKDHIPVLFKEGLVTDRKSIVMRAKNGTIIEVFEWKSTKAIEDAHNNPAVQELWKVFNDVCTYEKLETLEETKDMFAGFEPVDL
jgi:hypothetical protein